MNECLEVCRYPLSVQCMDGCSKVCRYPYLFHHNSLSTDLSSSDILVLEVSLVKPPSSTVDSVSKMQTVTITVFTEAEI